MNDNGKEQHAKATFPIIAERLIKLLAEVGIKAYIWHKANAGSVYIRFEDNRMGSIRIANHKERDRYKYKFNIRTDGKHKKGHWVNEDDNWRYYISDSHYKLLVPILQKRAEQVKQWPESKYKYNIPSFKKKKQ